PLVPQLVSVPTRRSSDLAPVLSGCTDVNAKTSDDAPGNCSTTVTYTQPTALDNCDGARTVTCSPASGSVFNKGTTLVTCTASDTDRKSTRLNSSHDQISY